MKKEYLVKQRDAKDCGCCCLLSIIKYYNGYIPLEKIRIDTHTTIEGTTAYHLIKSANKYGFDGIGLKINYDELLHSTHNLPVIVQLKLKNNLLHFVVVYKISKDKVTYMDPAKGYIKASKKDFLDMWTNICIVLKPHSKILVMQKRTSILSLLANIYKEEKNIFKRLLFTSLLITFFSILLSFDFKIILRFMEYNNYKIIYTILLLFTSFTIINIFLKYQKDKLTNELNKNIDAKVIIPFLHHIFKLPLKSINGRSKGEIITRVSELNNIKELFSNIIISIFLDSALALCSVYILFIINKELFFLLCLLLILYLIVSIIYNPFIYRKVNENIELETEFNSNLVEYLNNIESIKNLNLIDKINQDIEISSVSYLKDTYFFNKFINKERNIHRFIDELGLFIITAVGLVFIYQNQLSLINLITFNTILSFFANPIKNIADIIPKYNLIKVSFDKISEFNNLEEEKYKEEELVFTSIKICNLYYSYNGLDNVLSDFSCDILENDHVYIDGKSGTGKSTICKLILKYDDNYKGDIYLGGGNIKDYSIKTIRNNIAYVSQNEHLFSGTIKENLTLHEDYPLEKINNIVKICHIDEIVNKKPLRLDTMLFDQGANLSGGEKQRIILARALLQNKNIIILDEALNEVEEEIEVDIIKNLNKYFNNKTLIYISHRNHKHLFNKNIMIGKNQNELLQ